MGNSFSPNQSGMRLFIDSQNQQAANRGVFAQIEPTNRQIKENKIWPLLGIHSLEQYRIMIAKGKLLSQYERLKDTHKN